MMRSHVADHRYPLAWRHRERHHQQHHLRRPASPATSSSDERDEAPMVRPFTPFRGTLRSTRSVPTLALATWDGEPCPVHGAAPYQHLRHHHHHHHHGSLHDLRLPPPHMPPWPPPPARPGPPFLIPAERPFHRAPPAPPAPADEEVCCKGHLVVLWIILAVVTLGVVLGIVLGVTIA